MRDPRVIANRLFHLIDQLPSSREKRELERAVIEELLALGGSDDEDIATADTLPS